MGDDTWLQLELSGLSRWPAMQRIPARRSVCRRWLVVLTLILTRAEAWGPKPNETYTEVVPVEVPLPTSPPAPKVTIKNTYVIPDRDGACSRNEDAVKFQGLACMKKCETDANCLSANRKCVCDGVCGMSCVKQDKECPKLKPPDFGRMKTNGRLYGATTKYACRESYRLVGPSTRYCQADGRWSGRDPACIAVNKNVFCEGAPNVTNARHNASHEQITFSLNSTLFYSCYKGYHYRGRFTEAKCLIYNETAKWFGPDMHCEPKKCAPAQQIENGVMTSNCSDFPCRASYYCNTGFELVGRENTYCQSDGTWQPLELPTCSPVQCSPLRQPLHGHVKFASATLASTAHYTCSHGFMLLGDATRTCLPNKRWSGQDPICEAPSEIDCGMPGPLHNGWVGGNATSMNSQITYHCNEGTVRIGQSESATCSSNGRWSHQLPKCMGPCDLPRVVRGEVVNATSNRIQHGQDITILCQKQYEMQLSHEMPRCYNGTWTHVPICVPARCKALPADPEHGFVIAPKNEHGSRAKYMCHDGYLLQGNNLTTCQYGVWNGTTPHCDIVYCTFPGNVVNGSVLLVGNMGLYDYREYVSKVRNDRRISYQCHRGFTLSSGPPGATCVDGVWRPAELPTCSPDKHPTLTSWFNKRSVRSVRSRLVRRIRRWTEAAVARRRSDGHRPRSVQKRRRRRRRQPCDPILNQSYLRVEVVRRGKDANYTFSRGTRVKVTCGHGYQLNIGTKVARCVRGRWRPEKPSCVAMYCSLPAVEGGVWMQQGTAVPLSEKISHESVVDLTCEDGYNVQGNTGITCWYGSLPSQLPECVQAPCELPPLPHGVYTEPGYKPGLDVAHNFSVAYQCEPGYSVASEVAPRCQQGRLVPAAPRCRSGLLGAVSTDVAPDVQLPHPADYSVGGDITSALGIFGGGRRSCGPPTRVQNSVIYRNGQQANDTYKRYPDSTEITFNCVTGVGGDTTTWKIICEDGSWIGRDLSCDENEMQDFTNVKNKLCTFYNDMTNVMTFFDDEPVLEKEVEFPPGTRLTFRCDDIGKFAMIGSNRRTCVRGQWDGAKPNCFGLNQMNDYALEKPPTILFRHKGGPIAQSNDGKLLVFPGTMLHLECLWIRKFGYPTWKVSHKTKNYTNDYTTEEGRDSNLEYRLSIVHAQAEDSGSYTCITPPGHQHRVRIEVKAVFCPMLPKRPDLHKSTHDTKMNTVVSFTCADGNTLMGSQQMTCLPSGNWSAPLPHCETIECPEFPDNPTENVKVAVLSRQVTGKAMFECPRGYQRVGAHEAYCQVNGQWTHQPPSCQELLCETPTPPEHGTMGPASAKHMVGDVIQFSCNHGFMMQGQPIIECLENQQWSRDIPQCVQACTYPGSTIGGTISKVKFYYAIGEVVLFTCDNGLLLRGTNKLECLHGGVWSSNIPSCIGLP